MPPTRSAIAHRKVLDAALDLVAARGFDATSMDAIAEQSGVSKATIYKHWSDKDALLLEVMAHANGLYSRPEFESGDTRADIIAVLSYRPREHAELRERLVPQFMAYAARNPSFGDAWRQMVMDPPRRELRRLLGQGVRQGELAVDLDIEMSLSMLLGPMLYWYVFLRIRTADPKDLAVSVVDAFWRAFGRERRPGRRGSGVQANAHQHAPPRG